MSLKHIYIYNAYLYKNHIYYIYVEYTNIQTVQYEKRVKGNELKITQN